MNYTTSEPAHLKAGHPVFERNRRRLQIEADERDGRERSQNALQAVLEANLEDIFDRYGPHADQTHQAVFLYLRNRAESGSQGRSMAPKVCLSSKLDRKRREGTSRVSDADDYVSQLMLNIIENDTLSDFKGVNNDGENVRFPHWLNGVFRRNFARKWKEEKAYDKAHVRLDESADVDELGAGFITIERLNTEFCSEGTKRNGKVSADFGDSGTTAVFRSRDPEIQEKVDIAFYKLRKRDPKLAAALESGCTQAEAAKLCGLSAGEVSKRLSTVRNSLDKVGKRATGRVYAKPKGWTGPKSPAWLAREDTRKQREKENYRLSESIRRRGKPRKAEVISIQGCADVRRAGVAA
jgi:hypothetical protein